jgi:hypothetical protein
MSNLGSADGMLVWMLAAMKYGHVLSARINQWPDGLAVVVVRRFRLTPEG